MPDGPREHNLSGLPDPGKPDVLVFGVERKVKQYETGF